MEEPKRVYQVWKGKNKFFFGGRLMFGPDVGSLIFTLLLILAPVFVFCALVATKLLHELHSYNAGYAILFLVIFLTIYVLILLFLTSARDPGVVPRSTNPPSEEFGGYESSASVEVGGKLSENLQFPRSKEVFVNGVPVRVKYCETCMVYRPPRCSHCSICDNCVERFDHHCPWVGQCIGKRNYRTFFLFVSSSALLCITVFSMSALHMKLLINKHATILKAIKESPASLVLIAYCFVLLWFIGGLTFFHLYLICSNQTTYENFRRRGGSRVVNAFDRGCTNNFVEIFCGKTEPSRIKLRSYAHQVVANFAYVSEKNGTVEDRRANVEEGVDIGNDILKISQRRDSVRAGEQIR
ncbi:hypothetical protein ABFS82_08G235600 [Erythranthe guttata]|uniref:S-acyltransferase n=1 Tax=Erythranthe guttata TaxID=4155 RepID=A0A022QT74_ERYGU|nr:PREDICTED: protein S-acyltransferase 8-like isoform X1 [Erythranthe guttata]EYU31116.1 hypothetical protein MIMGU_mgv1a009087mg [Erythranthe guttata]|eukprot:XP_012844972.1 PREDICTED: protein S-acyltransferase 8-like isoform X1 [Erythranthe guttata]